MQPLLNLETWPLRLSDVRIYIYIYLVIVFDLQCESKEQGGGAKRRPKELVLSLESDTVTLASYHSINSQVSCR